FLLFRNETFLTALVPVDISLIQGLLFLPPVNLPFLRNIVFRHYVPIAIVVNSQSFLSNPENFAISRKLFPFPRGQIRILSQLCCLLCDLSPQQSQTLSLSFFQVLLPGT